MKGFPTHCHWVESAANPFRERSCRGRKREVWMLRKISLRSNYKIAALILLLAGVTACVWWSGKTRLAASSASIQATQLQPTGYPQLVSIEPMQEPDGEMCQLEPASASTTLLSEHQAQIA